MASELCGCDAQSTYIPTQRVGIDLTVEDLKEVTQRRIQNANGVSETEYIMHKGALNAYQQSTTTTLDNGSKPIKKHDSYQRRLARLKGEKGVLRDEKNAAPQARQGGKVQRFALFPHKNCVC